MTTDTRESISIDSSGNSVELVIGRNSSLQIVIRGDAAADYALDVDDSENGGWMQGVGSSYTGSSDYDDTRTVAAYKVRIRCTSGTAGSGDNADIMLASS